MALSTRVTLAVAGGVLAIGVLGAGGAAYASSAGDPGATSFVTTVDDGPTGAPAPSTGDRDCPYGSGGTGPTAPGSGTSTPGDA